MDEGVVLGKLAKAPDPARNFESDVSKNGGYRK